MGVYGKPTLIQIVVPVFKNVDRSQTANYRVISSITGFSKFFEISIYQ
jgi:hypothetical protein